MVRGVGLGGGQGGCERRIEVFGEIHKTNRGMGGGRVFGLGGGGVKVDVNDILKFLLKFKRKFKKKIGGSGRGVGLVGGVRVDVNEELKFWENSHEKKCWGREGGRVGGGGGVRVDVNAILGVGGDVGYGRCERSIEILYCTMYKKVLYNKI